jgi:hypothetical protein
MTKKMDFYIGPCVLESADLAKLVAELGIDLDTLAAVESASDD